MPQVKQSQGEGMSMKIKRSHYVQGILLTGALSCFSLSAYADAPAITTFADQQIQQGDTLVVPAKLSNANKAGTVNWSKAYGPDDVKVNPLTGTVTWQIPDNLPSESFYIGVRSSNLEGADIDTFIVHVGVSKVVYIGPNETLKNFNEALGAWKEPGKNYREPGTTFVVRNGEYSGENWILGITPSGQFFSLPNGNENMYTTLMAEDPGQVRLSGGARLMAEAGIDEVAYWAIKGFFMNKGRIGADGSNCNGEEACKPHHMKFIRNGIYQDHSNSYFGTGHSNYILFENNFSYGGNRAKFLAYKTKNVIFRRNIGRFDHNEKHTGPKNTFSLYTSIDVAAQNNIVVDGDTKEFAEYGELMGEFACPTTVGESRTVWDRNIQLNSDHPNSNLDLQAGKCDATIRDVVSWDIKAPFVVMTRSPSLFDHATFGAIHPDDTPLVLFNGWPGRNARGITNSIIHDVSKGPLLEGFATGTTTDLDGNSMTRFGVDTVNIDDFSGAMALDSSTVNTTKLTYIDPMWSTSNPTGGMRYLVRMEANSNMSGKAKDGGDLGARVMTFKGKSGTLWGEEGFDAETNVPVWPFPYQETAAENMRTMEYTGPTWVGSWLSREQGPEGTLSGDRGYAKADTDLTDYIWGYLGSTVPPMNVNAVGMDKSVVIRWDLPAPRADITGYKVYDYNPETQKISNPRNVGNVNSATISGLVNGTEYHFAVTAISASKAESSYSYPVTVTAQTHANPMPPSIQKHD